MSKGHFSGRSHPDACPGALQVHSAADGGLARVRVPGGRLTAPQLRELASAAKTCGNGVVELTSRANVQVRGLGAGDAFAARMAQAGLLPSATHERVRNVLASPLSGLDGRGILDVGPLTRELDLRLCGTPALAGLPGRFLFALDDGRGDVAWLGADAAILPTGPGEVALLLAEADSGLRMPPGSAVAALLTAAEAFLTEPGVREGRVWRIGELPGCAERVAARVAATLETTSAPVRRDPVPAPSHGPVGTVEQPSGLNTLGVTAPLGRLTSAQAALLAGLAVEEVRLTPWRGVVLPGLSPAALSGVAGRLVAAGLVLDPASPWTGVTACAGRPGCAKSLADVRADAARWIAAESDPPSAVPARPGTLPVHWAGCERRCGRPRGRAVDVVATTTGYRVLLEDSGLDSGLNSGPESGLNCADIEETTAAVAALRGET
ncbi:precorrin-3B synthase [Streptosporangium sp. NPDC020145]|uniref:precorrin-3B synthase n=1 Tax=Streptosporangium sp. NPDC020145 TaxID=3154694 RepID=UPI0034190323